jgi:hypothetical protein
MHKTEAGEKAKALKKEAQELAKTLKRKALGLSFHPQRAANSSDYI